MHFDAYLFGWGSIDNIDDLSVMATDVQEYSWIFTTVQNPHDGQHPVSGNRQFGIEFNEDGSISFFTRAADRVTGDLDRLFGENVVFKGGEKIWEGLQKNIANFVNKNGGKAKVNKPEVNRPKWKDVKNEIKSTN